MTAAPEIVAEKAAWERYRSYVVDHMPQYADNYGHGIFLGDEASRGLWREWKAAWDIRDRLGAPDLMRRRHRQYRWPT